MIARYTRAPMGAIWSDENKYRCWLEVELAASESLAELGEVPAEAAAALRRHADFSLPRIQEIEREVKHDVIAFTTAGCIMALRRTMSWIRRKRFRSAALPISFARAWPTFPPP
jgi:adenylosuccinate lyase